ncbi:hypothetical protein Tco_1144473 [Tanacetum coccineum]
MDGYQLSSLFSLLYNDIPLTEWDEYSIAVVICFSPKEIKGSFEAESIVLEQASREYGSVFRQRRSVQEFEE